MFRSLGLRGVAGLFCMTMVGWMTTSAPAQVGQFVPLATSLAPTGGLPTDLKLDVLNVIPDDAYAFFTTHHVLETKKTIEGVLKKLQVPYDADDGYDEFSSFLEKLQGWDEKGMHAVAILHTSEDLDDADAVVFVPVSSYAKFAESLGAEKTDGTVSAFAVADDGPKGFIASKANYAILADDTQGKELLERVLAAKKTLAGTTEAVSKWIAGYQFAAVLTRAGVEKTFDEAIKGLKDAQENIKEGNAGVDAAQQAVVVQVFGMYDDILKSARDEVTHLAVGGRLDESAGLRMAGEALFKSGGEYAKLAKNVAPLPADALKGLPDGDYFAAVAATMPSAWVDRLMEFSMNMAKNMPEGAGGLKLNDEQLKTLIAASKDMMKGMKFMSMSMKAAGEGIFGGVAGIYDVEDAPAFVKRYEEGVTQASKIAKDSDNPGLPDQEVDHVKVDGREVLTITTDLEKMLDQMSAQQPAMRPMMEAMFGNKGKMIVYMAAVGKNKVVLAYDEDMLKSLAADVESGKSGLASNMKLQKTAAMFPSSPHAVGFLSVGGMIELVKRVATQVMAAQGQAFPLPIPPFPDAAPIGIAGKITPTTLEGHLVVPMDLMEATRNYVMQMQAMFGMGGNAR